MRYLSLAAVLLLTWCWLIPGCSGKLIPTDPSARSQADSTYIGSWNWIKSIGGYAGETRTPKSAGYTIRIELTPDSIYNVYQSGLLTTSTRFSIHREKALGSYDTVDVISFPGTSIHLPARIRLLTRDTLNIVDQYMDGYSSFYSKVE